VNDRPDVDPDPVEVIRAGGLAVEAAKALAADPDDWAAVMEAAGPVLAWMRAWEDPADLEARQAAARAVMPRPARGARGRPRRPSPSQYVTAAESVRLALRLMLAGPAGPAGSGEVAPGGPDGAFPPRFLAALRNMIFAAAFGAEPGGPEGTAAFIAEARRYGEVGGPALDVADYDRALRLLFADDPCGTVLAAVLDAPGNGGGRGEVGPSLPARLGQVLARLDDAERRLGDIRDVCDRASFEAGGRAVWVIDVLGALLGADEASRVRHENLRPCYDRRCPECHPESERPWAAALSAMPAMGDGARYDIGRPVEWDGEHPDGVEVIAEAASVGEVNAMAAVSADLLLVRLAAPDTAGRQLPADAPALFGPDGSPVAAGPAGAR
jgi:hypothetical protein